MGGAREQKDPALQDITRENFLDKTREEQSLYARAIFEKAALSTITDEQVESIKKSVHILAAKVDTSYKYYLISDDKTIFDMLGMFNPQFFGPEKHLDEVFENTKCVEVTPEIILRYTSGKATAEIPGFQNTLTESGWRATPALTYDQGLPLLALRGYGFGSSLRADDLITPSFFNCDAQLILSQQLINYSYTKKTDVLLIEFPKEEGRGAVFSIADVPFHAYNSQLYNDLFCAHMGLFVRDNEIFYPIRLPLPSYLTAQNLVRDSNYISYSVIPGIKSWQETDYYHDAFMIRLDHFVEENLKYQRSLSQDDRIKREDGTRATDKEIDKALGMMKTFIGTSSSTARVIASVGGDGRVEMDTAAKQVRVEKKEESPELQASAQVAAAKKSSSRRL